MSEVFLSGQLICATDGEAALVARHLPRHVELTLAEPGCRGFVVAPTGNPLVWQVDEHFSDAASFEAHQARVRSSEWGRATAGIERRYTIEER